MTTMRRGSLTDVPGIRVGHAGDEDALTGCTVILPEQPAVCGVDVRGGAPGTRELALLKPGRLIERIDALLLTGGSAFGLAAADGVMRWLREQGRGYDTGVARVPIVPAAVLFDLAVGRGDVWPDAAMGRQACENAGPDTVCSGNVGAGLGATVGKRAGLAHAMRGGLGSASQRLPDGTTVAALAVVNCLGDVYDPNNGRMLAGCRLPQDVPPHEPPHAPGQAPPGAVPPEAAPPFGNTTLAVIATDATLDKAQATRVSEMAHDGLARTIRPLHTQFDGDLVFTLATGGARRPLPSPAALSLLGAAAADVLAAAVIDAVQSARGIPHLPAWRDQA